MTSFPRGRIQIGRTVQRAIACGVRHKAAIAYYQRSVDNPSNRCLLYAVWWLSQYVDRVQDELARGQRNRIRRDLNYAWHALPGVGLDKAESFLDDATVLGARPLPTLRSYYRPALDLALTIIGRKAVRLEASEGSLHLRRRARRRRARCATSRGLKTSTSRIQQASRSRTESLASRGTARGM